MVSRYCHDAALYADAYNEAVVVCLEKLHDYDPCRLTSFTTYVFPWMRSAILNFCLKQKQIVGFPAGHAARIDLSSAEEEINDLPVPKDVCMTEKNWRVYLAALIGGYVSLDEVAEIAKKNGFAAVEATLDWERLSGALTPEQRELIERHWGIGGAQQHSLSDIARALGVSNNTVSIRQREAIEKLRLETATEHPPQK